VTITAQNPYRGKKFELDGPFHQAVAVTPDDANDLPNICRGVVVTTTGVLKCTFADDTVPVLVPVTAGFTYRFMLSRVWATGTTCGAVIALY
jgi:hypothetical protein